jgi:MraZ protein
MFSGEFNVTLDDTGRIALPRKLRDFLEDGVIITKGADSNLWLFAFEQWVLFEKEIYAATNQFLARDRRQRQHFIGAKQKLDIDRQGRILIPPTLREHAGLSKDCIILGQVDYIELWDDIRYKSYLAESEDDFKAGLEEIGTRMKRERDLGNDSSRSGAAGTGSALPGAEKRE